MTTFCDPGMVLDDGEAATKEVGDRIPNQKTKQDSTYIRQQNILARINGVQNDYISCQGEMEELDFEKVDRCALVDKEDKGKIPVVKRRNDVLQGDN